MVEVYCESLVLCAFPLICVNIVSNKVKSSRVSMSLFILLKLYKIAFPINEFKNYQVAYANCALIVHFESGYVRYC